MPVGLMVVATMGTQIGLLVDLLVGILGTGDCCCMERVICLLSWIWGLGTLGGACTLGTHPGLWFPQICWDLLVSEPVLHQQYVTGSVRLESFWLCPSFLG